MSKFSRTKNLQDKEKLHFLFVKSSYPHDINEYPPKRNYLKY